MSLEKILASYKKTWKRWKNKHPTLIEGAKGGTQVAVGAGMEVYGTWMHDFDAPREPTDPEGPQGLKDFFEENPLESNAQTGEVGVPFILKMIGIPRKYWFIASRSLSFLGAYLLYKGSKKLGYVIGQANHANNESRLTNANEETLFDVYYHNEVEKVLRKYSRFHRFFSKYAVKGGLGFYILSQVIIALDWWRKYKYGLGDGLYALIWNDAYHLISLPALTSMASGGFYKGTINSEKPYDYEPEISWDGEKIIKEAILLKALDSFNRLGKKELEAFSRFLKIDFWNYNSNKLSKEERWVQLKDKAVRKYAIDKYLKDITSESIIEDFSDLNEEGSILNEKFIIYGKNESEIKIGEKGKVILDLFEGVGLIEYSRHRYLDKKLVKEELHDDSILYE
jgi:hypothetical protein